MVWLGALRQNGCGIATKRVVGCDKTGAALRQNGWSVAIQRVAPKEHCDKTGAKPADATKRVLKTLRANLGEAFLPKTAAFSPPIGRMLAT
jgi:hypothetical protein